MGYMCEYGCASKWRWRCCCTWTWISSSVGEEDVILIVQPCVAVSPLPGPPILGTARISPPP